MPEVLLLLPQDDEYHGYGNEHGHGHERDPDIDIARVQRCTPESEENQTGRGDDTHYFPVVQKLILVCHEDEVARSVLPGCRSPRLYTYSYDCPGIYVFSP